MHADERNGTERRIFGKSVARVKLRFNAPQGTSVMEERSFPAIPEIAVRLVRILFREGFVVASLIHSTSEPMAEWLVGPILF
jgi:hypothetical protein